VDGRCHPFKNVHVFLEMIEQGTQSGLIAVTEDEWTFMMDDGQWMDLNDW
jgi:hypothetical protein